MKKYLHSSSNEMLFLIKVSEYIVQAPRWEAMGCVIWVYMMLETHQSRNVMQHLNLRQEKQISLYTTEIKKELYKKIYIFLNVGIQETLIV